MLKDLTLEPGRKRHGNILLYGIARLFFLLTGWKVKGTIPANAKLVAIGAPHTSNYDGIMLLMLSWLLHLRLTFMIKAELGNHWLAGPIARALGGMPIDRSASRNAVQQAVAELEKREYVWLVIAPEGTRRKVDHWKTGFYWIAYNAKVPILCASIHYDTYTVDFHSPLIEATGDIEADMEKIWAYYKDGYGRHPEKAGTMAMRPSGKRDMGESGAGKVE